MAAPLDPYRAPPPAPPPPRPALVGLGLGAALALGLALFTSNKLVTMARLRGDMEGLEPRTLRFEGLAQRYSAQQAKYRLSDPSAPNGPTWTIQLGTSQAVPLRNGDLLTVRCLDDERECFTRESVYVSDGNVQFDRGLLVVELLALVGCTFAGVVRWRAWRGAVRATAAPRAKAR